MSKKPGGGGGSGAHSDFAYLTDERLSNNSNLIRMPTDQRGWNSFIQELSKWIKDETGSFDPVFTGFSSAPGATTGGEGPTIWWHRYGQMVHMQFVFGLGTSDQTFFTITNLPEVITPRDDARYSIWGLQDNSSTLTDEQMIKVGSNNVLTFYSSVNAGAWTNSMSKGFGTRTPPDSIIYSLRQPGKQ